MYPYFILLFCIGIFFLFLSVWFLPFIIIAPRKCANLINAGSICIISSFAVLNGPYEFFKKLIQEKGLVFVGYLGSLAATIYASMVLKSYILTIAAMAIEVVCLMSFMCSYFPGG